MTSRRMASVLAAALTAGLVPSRAAAGGPAPCTGRDENVRCLARNFDVLSQADDERFWAILSAARPRPEGCKPDQRTVDFLALARVETVNAEFQEFFAGAIEHLCIEAPECFRKASAKLDPAILARLRKLLETPVFVQDPGVVARAGCLPGDPAREGTQPPARDPQ